MAGQREEPPFRAGVLVALACAAALFGSVRPVRAGGGSRCLTPDVGRALQDFIATGALARVFPNGLTLQRLDVSGQEIELEVQDDAHHPYAITLTQPGSRDGQPDGQGRQFLFYLTAASGPARLDAAKALLNAAALFDQAIPETALRDCSGGPQQAAPGGSVQPGAAGGPGQGRVGRALALASGMLEVTVVLAAILFGVRAIRSPRGPIDGDG